MVGKRVGLHEQEMNEHKLIIQALSESFIQKRIAIEPSTKICHSITEIGCSIEAARSVKEIQCSKHRDKMQRHVFESGELMKMIAAG